MKCNSSNLHCRNRKVGSEIRNKSVKSAIRLVKCFLINLVHLAKRKAKECAESVETRVRAIKKVAVKKMAVTLIAQISQDLIVAQVQTEAVVLNIVARLVDLSTINSLKLNNIANLKILHVGFSVITVQSIMTQLIALFEETQAGINNMRMCVIDSLRMSRLAIDAVMRLTYQVSMKVTLCLTILRYRIIAPMMATVL